MRRRLAFSLLGVMVTGLGAARSNAQGSGICSAVRGSPVVYGNCNGNTASSAYIDASIFKNDGNNNGDVCQTIKYILTTPSIYTRTGTVIDARGILPAPGQSSEPCGTDPFNGGTTLPTTVLLPLTTVFITQTWVLPRGTRILGGGTPPSGRSSGVGGRATLQVANAGNFSGTSMIQMCPSGICTGISVEHLTLNGLDATGVPTPINAINNAGAGPSSYVDDVNLNFISLTGLLVASNAARSGPYTNINFTSAPLTSCTSGSCPVCAQLGALTSGVDGITCIGVQAVSGLTLNTQTNTCQAGTPPLSDAAAIMVQAGGNSIRNAHIEAFWDGIQIGNPSSSTSVSVVEVANLTTGTKPQDPNTFLCYGPVTNAVHICGATTTGASGACFSGTPGAVSSVSLFQISSSANNKQLLRDDVTNRTVTTAPNLNTVPLGMYLLGKSSTIGAQKAYPILSTASGNNGTAGSNIPTWVTGSGPASGPCNVGAGSIYSNTSGTVANKNTIYVCSGTSKNWVAIQ